jgi:hypothetical protein
VKINISGDEKDSLTALATILGFVRKYPSLPFGRRSPIYPLGAINRLQLLDYRLFGHLKAITRDLLLIWKVDGPGFL